MNEKRASRARPRCSKMRPARESSPSRVGAVVGGALGPGVGSLIGSVSGCDVAMVLGTMAAQSQAMKSRRSDQPIAGQQGIVRTGNGVLTTSLSCPLRDRLILAWTFRPFLRRTRRNFASVPSVESCRYKARADLRRHSD